jgi:hypothetical protein
VAIELSGRGPRNNGGVISVGQRCAMESFHQALNAMGLAAFNKSRLSSHSQGIAGG